MPPAGVEPATPGLGNVLAGALQLAEPREIGSSMGIESPSRQLKRGTANGGVLRSALR